MSAVQIILAVIGAAATTLAIWLMLRIMDPPKEPRWAYRAVVAVAVFIGIITYVQMMMVLL